MKIFTPDLEITPVDVIVTSSSDEFLECFGPCECRYFVEELDLARRGWQ
jgi:hypothetical protein